ncbi:uncharacterized protein LOC117828262 isoform X2 [Notolabrus celidotus]|nr:uncharacterized protein LOC117828262 isoform X2 [Notolabrus celidotus]
MKLCVNLMPLLAAARETMEEEEEEEEDSSCKKEKEAETRNKDDPCVTKSEDKTSLSNSGFSLNVSPRLVLPPLTQPAAAPESLKTKRCHTPLPPISSSEQTNTMSSNSTTKSFPGDVTAERDSRPWIHNPLLSQSRSAEFHLPDISLCSLDALLQTVTQKLRRKRRGGDEELWRRVQSDHLLLAVSDQRAGQKIENKQPADVDAERGASVNRWRRLPPLFPTQRPTLILSMTKRNLLTPNPLQ